MLSFIQKLLLSFTSATLLSLPWLDAFPGLILMVALVPLLILGESILRNGKSGTLELFWYAMLTFFLWNASTTWWLGKVTIPGAIAVITLNAILYSSVFLLACYSKKIAAIPSGWIFLVIYWIAFEYAYLNTDYSWPWLNLGNGLSNSVKFIQWYEYTGTLGGTLWILLANIVVTEIVLNYSGKETKLIGKKLTGLAFLVFIPVLSSLLQYYTYKEELKVCKIAVLQPNIDPYHEKYDKISPEEQLNILLVEARKVGRSDLDYFIGPETAIVGYNPENNLHNNHLVIKLRKFLHQYPNTGFVIGAETVKEYLPDDIPSFIARKKSDENIWYNSYNSALRIDIGKTILIYHKSQLVSGVEKMPYSKYFGFLERYGVRLGGAFGTLGSQSYRTTFPSSCGKFNVAPVICYESVYGEYLGGYINKGANILFIITNDGWFGNTSGHKLHLSIARLRAIETRRSVARSANTGISALINQRGDVISSMCWGKQGALTGELNTNNKITFYVRHGDYIGIIALYLAMLAIAFTIYIKIRNK